MNRYPAKPIMDEMAKYGRYGDTMLVHMNPVEVAGIASLVPGGKLTTNPVTGQPEAFLPLIFGLAGGALGLGTLGTAALTGIGTAAVTGDLKRGLLAGVTSGLTAGIGEGLAEGLDVATEGVDAVTTGADAVTTGADAVATGADVATQAVTDASTQGLAGLTDYTGQAADMAQKISDVGGYAPVDYMAQAQNIADTTAQAVAPAVRAPNMSDQIFGSAEGIVQEGIGRLGTSGQLVGAMTAEGVSQQMQAQQDFERQQAAMREESEAKRRQAYEDLQGAYAMAQPGAQTGYSPYRSMMSRNTPPPMYAAEGGVVRMQEGGEAENGETGSATPKYDPAAVAAYLAQLQELGFSGINFDYMGQNINLADYDPSAGVSGTGDVETPVVDPADYTVTPTEAEREALRIAGRGQILGAERQAVLEGYYNRLNQANQAYRDATATSDAQGNAATGINDALAAAGVPGFTYMGGMTQPGYGGLDPVTIQKNLRGGVGVAPPADYMTGFEPEFSYFQEDPTRIITPTRQYRPTARRFFGQADYFDPILDREAYLQQISDYYTKLGGYMPEDVFYPEVPDTTPDDTDTTGGGGGVPPVETITRDEINALYQELFGRDALDAGADYWISQVVSGNVSRDRLREALIAGAQGSDREYYERNVLDQGGGDTTTDTTDTTTDTTGTTTDTTTTTTDTTTETPTTTPDTTPVDTSQYMRPAELRSVDPYLWSKRGFVQGVEALPASKEELTAEEFQKIIAGQQGKYGEGSKLTYDPSVGAIYSTVPEGRQAEFSETGGVPFSADPRTLSDVQRIRFNSMSGGTLSRTFKEGDKTYRISAQQQTLRIGDKQYFVNPDGSVTAYTVKDIEYDFTPRFNAGGTIPLRSSMGNAEVSAGGIANVPTEFTATMPTEQEFNMVAAAVLGRVENPDAIVDMFVRKYGPEMFQQIRNMVLRSVAPQAQTEGMIRGQGSGMEDKIPGMIGDQQPVAVSPGEFIVPADVVSGLGDGSSDAGAEKLDRMMDRVRMARGGTTRQAPSIDADGMMPA